MKQRILIVGLNPAYQKILTFERFAKDSVNRANASETIASGKGINFYRALCHNGEGCGTLFQFLVGETGTQLSKWLDEEGLQHQSQYVATSTRICITCLDAESATEVIEPTLPIAESAQKGLLKKIKMGLNDSSAVAICGTMPNGIDGTFYRRVIEYAQNRDVPILLDAFDDIELALSKGVTILKINRHELEVLTGKQDICDGIKCLQSHYSIPIIAISDGAACSFLSYQQELYQFTLPKIKNVINPIGAGDTLSAVFFQNYLNGTDVIQAFSLGLAAASASCLTTRCGVFKKEEQLNLYKQLKIEKV